MKAAIKYQFNDMKNGLLVYYGGLLSIFIFIILLGMVSGSSANAISGLESVSAIFLLIIGITGFKENFLFFMQNSISRKSIWKSRIIIILWMCGFVAIIDKILLNILGLIFGNSQIIFEGLFEMIYESTFSSLGTATSFIIDFLLTFGLYFALSALGYFIGILFYRLSKIGKVIVGVCAYAIPFVIVPLLDYWVFNGKLITSFTNIFVFLFGIKTGNPLPAILSFISIGIIFFILSWLLMRKAVMGDKK